MNDANSDIRAETREQVAAQIYAKVRYLLEEGNSQVLSREHALQIAADALKIAGLTDLQHEVLSYLVELPENYG